MPEVNSRNFFVGPKTISQRDRFFGRETEITRLTHRLLAERIVLMYSPSGAGKSSLIAAGVLDEFTRVTNAEFHILPTVRLHLTTNGAGHAASPFSQAAVRCLLGSQEAPDGSLPFDSIASLVGYSKEAAAKARGNTEVCLLLVFDQFEECLTLLPDRLDAAAALFDDLSRVLDDENVWALFAIREDLLAPILDLGRRMPTRFRHTFRLDFLRGEDAKVVVEKTLALGGYTLEKNALKELVDDLTLVNVQDQHGNFRWRPGEYVEPLHLQVVWTYILNQLPPGKNLISRQELKRSMAEGIASVSTPGAGLVASVFGGNGECTAPISRVDDALAAYYAGELSRICRGNIEQERDLRFWIEEKLIDAKRTRIPVRQGTEQTDGLENASVEMLYEAYIVRKERRLNAFWYELAHDRLVQPILLDNAKWFEAKLGPVAQRYRRWKQTGKLDRYLLTRRELRTARRQEAIIGHASPGEQEFIQKSRESARRAIVRFWMAIVIPLLFGTGVTAFLAKSKLDAQRLSHLRQFSALRPLFSQWSPVTLDQNSLFLSQLIKQMSKQGEPADPMLVGNFYGLLDGMLYQWRSRLEETDWNFPFLASGRVSSNPWSVLAIASAPDGDVAIGDTHSNVRILHQHLLARPITLSDRAGQIQALAYAIDGSQLAVGTEKDFVWIVDAYETGSEPHRTRLRPPLDAQGRVPTVHSCSWNVRGDFAAACQDGKVYVWPGLLPALAAGNQPMPVVVENRIGDDLSPVLAVAWNPEGTMFAIGDAAGNVRVWSHDALSGPTDPATRHHGRVSSVGWSNNKRLASGSWDHSISIWEVRSPGRANILVRTGGKEHAHDQWIRDLTWIDDNRLVSVGDDNWLRFWKDADLKDAGTEMIPASTVHKMCYNAVSRQIVTADGDGAVRMYNLMPRTTSKYGYYENAILSLAVAGTHLVSLDSQGMLCDLDLREGKEPASTGGPVQDSTVESVRFHSPLNAFVVGSSVEETGPARGRLSVLQPPSKIVRVECDQPVTIVSCHPQEPVVAFVTAEPRLGLMSLPDLKPITGQAGIPIRLQPEFHVIRAEWSADGKNLLLALNDRVNKRSELRMYQFDGARLLQVENRPPISLPGRLINQMAWRPGKPLVALGTTEGAIILCSLPAGRIEFNIVSHVGRVTALTWFADGRKIISAGDDRSIKIWDYDSELPAGLTLITAIRSDGAVHTVAFASDGNGFYAAGSAPQIAYYPAARYSRSAILTQIRPIINRNMFPAEWTRFTLADELGGGTYQKTFDELPDLSLPSFR